VDGGKVAAETGLDVCMDGNVEGVVGRDAGTGRGKGSNAVGVARGVRTRQWVDAAVIGNENANVTEMGWDKTNVKATPLSCKVRLHSGPLPGYRSSLGRSKG